jgi:hypothetical protein
MKILDVNKDGVFDNKDVEVMNTGVLALTVDRKDLTYGH